MEKKRSEIIKKAKRTVVKIGSSVLLDRKGKLSNKVLIAIAKEIAQLQGKKINTLLVSSGAIAAGMEQLGFKKRPNRLAELQACAAVGQPILMQLYQKAFQKARLRVAQVLLTRGELENRNCFINAKNTLERLLEHGIVPIVNENDTVAVEEIRFGDNDNLAALVTNVAQADLLILLTDRDGFYSSDPGRDPNAKRIPLVENIDQKTYDLALNTDKSTSTGGMKTKIEAAQKAAQFGIPTLIANGFDPFVIKKILGGEEVGTLFLPSLNKMNARKHWIAHTLQARGRLTVDEGAYRALTEGKKSLLPSGIVKIEGKFESGDAVDVETSGGTFARGLIAYGDKDLGKIIGKKSSEIGEVLGYKGPDEAIHRDDLVLL